MARGINKVILVGNLGQDPELRYTGNGTAVCNMRLATNEAYKDADGNLVDKTEWHSVVAWSRLAEICGEYLKKGSQVYFEGSLQTRSWEDQNGQTRYTTEIKAREMMILSSRDGNGGGSYSSDEYDQRPAAPRQQGGGSGQRGQGNGQQRPQGGGQRPAAPAQQRPSNQRQPAPPSNDDYTFEPDDDLPF